MAYANADPRATDRTGTTEKALDARLVRYLERLAAGGFFGKVVMSFQNGKEMDVRIEQTRKVDEL